MTAFQIVTIVSRLIAAGQTNEQIADTLDAMGAIGLPSNENSTANGEALEQPDPNAERIEALRAELEALTGNVAHPEPVATTTNGESKRMPPRRNVGAAPMVKYHLATGWTAARIASKLAGRKLQIATLIAQHNKTGITKREVLATLQQTEPSITNAAVMSAIHALTDREIARSVEIAPAKPAARPTAAVRRPLR